MEPTKIYLKILERLSATTYPDVLCEMSRVIFLTVELQKGVIGVPTLDVKKGSLDADVKSFLDDSS